MSASIPLPGEASFKPLKGGVQFLTPVLHHFLHLIEARTDFVEGPCVDCLEDKNSMNSLSQDPYWDRRMAWQPPLSPSTMSSTQHKLMQE